MPTYTMRLTWPGEDKPNDYVFLIDGKEAGRCYQMRASDHRLVWRWTVYGSAMGGLEDTLAIAERKFKEATSVSE